MLAERLLYLGAIVGMDLGQKIEFGKLFGIVPRTLESAGSLLGYASSLEA